MGRKRGFAETENSKVKTLLPIKQSDGRWVYPTQALPEEQDVVKNESSPNDGPETVCEKTVPSTFVEKLASERAKLTFVKSKIAILCNTITSNPEKSMSALKELIAMLQKPKTKMIVQEKKLLMISLLRVFTDILPTYKIRQNDEGDKKPKFKKETKVLLNYESSLLRYYKKYIDSLQSMLSNMKSKPKNGQATTAAKRQAFQKIGTVATRCFCELLVARHYFNYSKTLINIIVPLACNKNAEVSDMCCQALEKMYKSDTLGEASLDAVKQTVKVVKERQFNIPTQLLRTFLSLKLQEAKIDDKSQKADMKKIRRQMMLMSRKEKKYKKKMEDLGKQLRETDAEESKTTKSKFQTDILKKMFWIFFHVLKDDHKMLLMTPVLEGLSKFAHLINLEFFDDLSSVLCGLMENSILSDSNKLHCMQTLFVILSGQAESMNIDPQRLYSHLYNLLLNLHNDATNDQFDATLKCLDQMLVRRKKKITYNRVLAFMKRLTTITLQNPMHFSLATLSIIRSLMINIKSSDILLDTDSGIGTGIYLPELEDPEYCNPGSATLWELHLLLKHYCPLLSTYAKHILHGCPLQGNMQLSEKITLLPPEDILQKYLDVAEGSRLEVDKCPKPPKRRRLQSQSSTADTVSEQDTTIPWKLVAEINFCKDFNAN